MTHAVPSAANGRSTARAQGPPIVPGVPTMPQHFGRGLVVDDDVDTVELMSGQPDIGLRPATLKRGAVDYLGEPTDPENLLRVVAAAFRRRAVDGVAGSAPEERPWPT